MNDIPTEVKRMADIYRALCVELGPPKWVSTSFSIDHEDIREMANTIFIHGAKGTGNVAVIDPSKSLPSPTQRDAGQPPASERKGDGSASGVGASRSQGAEPEGRAEPKSAAAKSAAPSNPDLSDKQIAWLFGHGWKKEDIEKMSSKEAYWTINKAMKGGK